MGIALVLSVPPAISVGASASNEVLISHHRPAVASSTHDSAGPAANATDSAGDTEWASADGPGTQWIRIDLGGVRKVDRVRLRWQQTYAKAYRVQTSLDGVNWADVYRTSAGDGGTDDLKRLDGSGRYVRILALERGGDSGGYSLSDVRAYGPAAAAVPVVEHTASADASLLAAGLDDSRKKETAFQLVASAENSTLDWRSQYGYLEDLGDGRGYTGGIIGFCSGTSDMLAVVTEYTRREPANVLARFLPALRTVDGSDSHAGLDPTFPAAWRLAATDPIFQKVQEDERDWMYFIPAMRLARADGVRALGQFAYYDAAVMHGVDGLRGIRATALRAARSPAQGGDEISYLNAFLDARVAKMRTEPAHRDTTRVDTAQRAFLRTSNLDLDSPLAWKVYGDKYRTGN